MRSRVYARGTYRQVMREEGNDGEREAGMRERRRAMRRACLYALVWRVLCCYARFSFDLMPPVEMRCERVYATRRSCADARAQMRGIALCHAIFRLPLMSRFSMPLRCYAAAADIDMLDATAIMLPRFSASHIDAIFMPFLR